VFAVEAAHWDGTWRSTINPLHHPVFAVFQIQLLQSQRNAFTRYDSVVLAIVLCLSVCPSQVCVLAKRLNGSSSFLTEKLYSRLFLHCLGTEFGYLQKYENFPLELVPNSGLRKSSSRNVDPRMISCQLS